MVGVFVVEGGLGARVCAQDGKDAFSLEPCVSLEKFVKGSVLKGEVLKPLMVTPLGIDNQAGQLDKG